MDGWLVVAAMLPLGYLVVNVIGRISPPSKSYVKMDAKDTHQYHKHELPSEEYKFKIFWFFV